MTYLIAEMLFWLLAAAALGAAAAWLIRGALGSQRAAGMSESVWSARMTAAEADFEARALAAEAAVARHKADLHAATNKLTALEADGGKRVADLEANLRTALRAAEALAAERGTTIEQLRTALTSANTQWMNRLADAEDKAQRLADRLEAAEAAAQATPEADPGATAALEAEIATLRAQIADLQAAPPAAAKPAKKNARPAPPPGEDDLQAITGLGPVMERTLKAQGIVTFRALAELAPDAAKALGVRAKWQEQARTMLPTGDGA
jgi:predicted flap endonuclease-1-like 5' DNA nuclease